MIITKPLATRADGVSRATQASRVKRGIPLSSANNFASFMVPEQQAGIPLQKTGQALLDEHARQAAKGNSTLATVAQFMGNGANPLSAPMGALDAAKNALVGENGLMGLIPVRQLERPAGLDGVETAIRVSSHRAKSLKEAEEAERFLRTANTSPVISGKREPATLGALAARFESGKDGIAAIGYDRNGGTSYGKYQLSSRAGSMQKFISFLKTEEPEWAERLESAGPANTGSKRGKMPDAWRALAQENPERLERLQAAFIRQSHFDPAVDAIESQTGVAFGEMPTAMQEVVFSTAVQHGPSAAARLITRAMDQIGLDKFKPESGTIDSILNAGENLIRRIYALRSGQFGSSTPAVQTAVKSRLNEEMSVAINMFKTNSVA